MPMIHREARHGRRNGGAHGGGQCLDRGQAAPKQHKTFSDIPGGAEMAVYSKGLTEKWWWCGGRRWPNDSVSRCYKGPTPAVIEGSPPPPTSPCLRAPPPWAFVRPPDVEYLSAGVGIVPPPTGLALRVAQLKRDQPQRHTSIISPPPPSPAPCVSDTTIPKLDGKKTWRCPHKSAVRVRHNKTQTVTVTRRQAIPRCPTHKGQEGGNSGWQDSTPRAKNTLPSPNSQEKA